jgi:membrane-associated phospholipid phosphatase
MATGSNIRPNLHRERTGRNPYQDLRSPGWLATRPGIGTTMLLLGSIIFIALAFSVTKTNGPVLQWDLAATRALHAQLKNIPASLVEYVIFGFFAGKEMVIAIGLILAIYFAYKRFWRELSMVLIGMGGGALLWYFFNQYFDRPRPAGQLPILPLTDPSFPSGLAMAAVLCYGLLGYLLIPRITSRALKWIISIALLAVILWIGLSTILAGDHYVTDVIAGYALGIAWAGLVYTLMERSFADGRVRDREIVPVTGVSEGLRTPGLFHYRPVVGLILVLLGGLCFAGLSYNLVSHGPLLQVDTTVYKDLIREAKTAPPFVNEIMIFGFFVGKQLVLLIVTILCIYFIYKRYWRELAMILLSSAVGSIVWNFVISYFARPRPPDQTGMVVKTIPSFPSGHTMSALIVYGFLAYLLIPKMPSRFWKWTVALASVFIILFIGFSRAFQGGHYLTDVIGGYAFGLAWASLIYLLMENIFWKRKV